MDRRIHVAEIHDEGYSFRASATPLKGGWAIEVIDLKNNTLANWRQVDYHSVGRQMPRSKIWEAIDEAVRDRNNKRVIASYVINDRQHELIEFGAKYVVATTYFNNDRVTAKNFKNGEDALAFMRDLMS